MDENDGIYITLAAMKLDQAIAHLRALVDELDKFKTESEAEGIVIHFVPGDIFDATKQFLEGVEK